MSSDDFFKHAIERFTVERFLGNCSIETRDMLKAVWRDGEQLASEEVPVDGLPCVVLLAAYARNNGVDLVDDYPRLIERAAEYMGAFDHPDKFLVSGACNAYLAQGDRPVSDEAFEAVHVPQIYEELLG
jgi:hypothetical protein